MLRCAARLRVAPTATVVIFWSAWTAPGGRRDPRRQRGVDDDGGVRAGRDGLFKVRGRRARARPGGGAPDRLAVGGAAGDDRVAQAAVGLPGAIVSGGLVRGAGRAGRRPPGASSPRVRVGGRFSRSAASTPP